MISGGDTGGAKTHVFSLMSVLPKLCDIKIVCFIKGQFFDELQDIDVESELIEQKSRFDPDDRHGLRCQFVTSVRSGYSGRTDATDLYHQT